MVAAEGANGKGHTPQQALATALMEMVERYSCFKLLREQKDTPYQTSHDLVRRHVKPEDLISLRKSGGCSRPPGSELSARTPILWYPGLTLGGSRFIL